MNWDTCSTTELLRHWFRRLDSNQRPRRDEREPNSATRRKICARPMRWTRNGFGIPGRESNPHLPASAGASIAVGLPGLIIKAQRPTSEATDKRRTGSSIGRPIARDLNPLASSRRLFPITQISGPSKLGLPMRIELTSPGFVPGVLSPLNYGGHTKKAMGKWRDRTEALQCRESNPDRQGLRRGRYALLCLVEDNRSTSAHRNWVGQRDLHPHRRLHRA